MLPLTQKGETEQKSLLDRERGLQECGELGWQQKDSGVVHDGVRENCNLGANSEKSKKPRAVKPPRNQEG